MKLFNWFQKKKNTETQDQKESYLDIIISLNKSYEIDFSVFLDEKISGLPMNEKDYAILCSSFINAVLSNKMKKDTVEILDTQIKNKKNSKLITGIISLITIEDDQKHQDHQFIKPSEVFAKYII